MADIIDQLDRTIAEAGSIKVTDENLPVHVGELWRDSDDKVWRVTEIVDGERAWLFCDDDNDECGPVNLWDMSEDWTLVKEVDG